jgi:hypothetical protein
MIPLWLKIGYTLMAAVVAVAYARKYKWGNFLWFSDIALLATVPALWLESRLLASVMAVGVLLPELFWNAAFFARLIAGLRFTELTDYMFDAQTPRWLRGLSLFHVALPVVLVWTVARLGYHPDAWTIQTAISWVVLPLSYWCTDPKENTNWVHSAGRISPRLPPLVFLGLLFIAFPVLLYLPTHFLLNRFFGR